MGLATPGEIARCIRMAEGGERICTHSPHFKAGNVLFLAIEVENNMNRIRIALLVLIAVPFSVLADDAVVGYVKTVSGSAAVVNAGNPVEAMPGTPIHMKDILKTGAGSAMGVTFKDNTVMSFGPSTEVTVDEFLYAPAKDELSLSAKITQGTLEYISGVIAKLKPQAVSIKTPSGTIGVRGTHFLVKVDASSETSREDMAAPPVAMDADVMPADEEAKSMENPQNPRE